MSDIQYQAKIENGEMKSEEGYFFKAGSFSIVSEKNKYECEFNRLENGAVIWHIKEDSKSIYKLTHPDYVPEEKPGQNIKVDSLKEDNLIIFDAFNKLDISKDKEYKIFFENYKKKSYSIIQKKIS